MSTQNSTPQSRQGETNSEVDCPIGVTFFPNQSAQKLQRREMTLEELRDVILAKSASRKRDLPFLKLAMFGEQRTDKNCLRHDANVLSISGVELDYDAALPLVSFENAVETIKNARLRALVYTSPSYTEVKPKWRVLLPASRDLPPGDRLQLVKRVNGLFDGKFSGGSFTLSQGFYFGSVKNNPTHRAVIVDGDYIDERGDLDAGARGKSKKGNGEAPASDDDELIEQIATGEHYHEPLLVLSAKEAARGASPERATRALQSYMDASAGPRDERWSGNREDIPRLVSSARQKFAPRRLPPPSVPMAVAREFASEYCTRAGLMTLHHWRGGWWEWHGAHWCELEDREVRSTLYSFTENAVYTDEEGEPKSWAPNRHRIGDVVDALIAVCLLRSEIDQPSWLQRGHRVGC